MVQIYNEITVYIYKATPDPVEWVPPLYTPPHGRVYILLGCKFFMGYKHD